MRNLKILDLKKALFYYLFSWRTILLCVALCVAFAVGITYLRPVTQDVEMSELNENELSEKRDKFIASDVMAKGWAAEISALEKELLILQDELSNSLFLQIDPEQRMNKRFTLRFTHFNVNFNDEAERIRADQMLCLQYVRELSDNRYMNYLAMKGILKFDPADLINLVDMTIKLEGYIDFTVTAPEEIIIDQLVKMTKDYLEEVVRPEIDLLAIHFLEFSNVKKEIVKDPSVIMFKERIESDIRIKQDNIEELNQMIDMAFEESLKEDETEIPSGLTVQSVRLKYVFAALLLGFLLSAFISFLRYRDQIVRDDVSVFARERQVPYLGEIPYYSERAKRRGKRFGRSIDIFFINLFGMAYEPSEAVNRVEYVVQVLQSTLKNKMEKENSFRKANILIPYVQGDASAETLVSGIRNVFKLEGGELQVDLISGASLQDDPDTIEAARECFGLLLLSKSSSKNASIKNASIEKSIQRSDDLSKDIVGILEMDMKW